MIVYFTPKKYDLKVIPTGANEVSEVEESIELIKISSRQTGTRNDSFTKYNINNMLL
jgi:hypothetical protein